MKFRGHVHKGVVVLEDGGALPEGARVTVSCDTDPGTIDADRHKSVEFPLVRSKQPGALRITPDDIAQALDDEEFASGR